MKSTIGLVLVCCLSSQVYAGFITSGAHIVKKAARTVRVADELTGTMVKYSQKKIDGELYRSQDFLALGDKIPVSITRVQSKLKIESHGKNSFIDIDSKSINGEVLGFRVESRSKIDVRIVLQVLEKDGLIKKMNEVTYLVKPNSEKEVVKATARRVLTVAEEKAGNFKIQNYAVQGSIKPKKYAASEVR